MVRVLPKLSPPSVDKRQVPSFLAPPFTIWMTSSAPSRTPVASSVTSTSGLSASPTRYTGPTGQRTVKA